jgi:hypothetical protein
MIKKNDVITKIIDEYQSKCNQQKSIHRDKNICRIK